MSRSPLLLLLAVTGFATSARADDATETTDLASRNDGDAAAGRSYFGPTALTTPGGTAGVSVRMPMYPAALVNGVVGITDWLEVSGGAGAFLILENESNEPPVMFDLGTKVQVVRSRYVAIAATATAFIRPGYVRTDPFEDATTNEPAQIIGEVGAVGTACLDAGCAVIASAHGHVISGMNDRDDLSVWAGGSLVVGRGHSRLVLDATALRDVDDGRDEGLLGYVGYRAARATWSFDAGMLVARDDYGNYPWPTFGFSARF